MARLTLCLFAVLFTPLLWAQSTLKKEISNVSKKEWIAQVQQSLPPLLCKSDEYFITCFDTTPAACQAFTSSLVQSCLNTAALPEQLDLKQGEYWGQLIARCSHELYEKFMYSKKRALPACHAIPKSE